MGGGVFGPKNLVEGGMNLKVVGEGFHDLTLRLIGYSVPGLGLELGLLPGLGLDQIHYPAGSWTRLEERSRMRGLPFL